MICGAAGSGLLLFLWVLYDYYCYFFPLSHFKRRDASKPRLVDPVSHKMPTGQMEITADCRGDFPGEQQGGSLDNSRPSASCCPKGGAQPSPRRIQIRRAGRFAPTSFPRGFLLGRRRSIFVCVPPFLSDFPVKGSQARRHMETRPLGAIAGCLLREDERAKGRSYS